MKKVRALTTDDLPILHALVDLAPWNQKDWDSWKSEAYFCASCNSRYQWCAELCVYRYDIVRQICISIQWANSDYWECAGKVLDHVEKRRILVTLLVPT